MGGNKMTVTSAIGSIGLRAATAFTQTPKYNFQYMNTPNTMEIIKNNYG